MTKQEIFSKAAEDLLERNAGSRYPHTFYLAYEAEGRYGESEVIGDGVHGSYDDAAGEFLVQLGAKLLSKKLGYFYSRYAEKSRRYTYAWMHKYELDWNNVTKEKIVEVLYEMMDGYLEEDDDGNVIGDDELLRMRLKQENEYFYPGDTCEKFNEFDPDQVQWYGFIAYSADELLQELDAIVRYCEENNRVLTMRIETRKVKIDKYTEVVPLATDDLPYKDGVEICCEYEEDAEEDD